MGKFDGKIVVVTGGAQGIGRAITRTFAREGAKVMIIDTDGVAGCENADWINNNNGQAVFYKADVADEQQVDLAVKACEDILGGLDILINNAGIGCGGTILDRPMELWDRVMAVNLRGPYLMASKALPFMKAAGGGVILNIASTRALMSEPDTEPYSASKGGLLALTHSLAVSLGRFGIRVNCICPGWIETSDWKKSSLAKAPVHTEEDRKQHPVGRVGVPQDIAEACIFLASSEAGFITGANLVIDGGMTIKMIYA